MKLFSRKKSNSQINDPPPSISRPRAQGHLPPTTAPRPSPAPRRLSNGPGEPVTTPLYARFARAESLENLSLNLRGPAESRTPSVAPSSTDLESDAQRLGYDRPWARERQTSLDAPKVTPSPKSAEPSRSTFDGAMPAPPDRTRSPLAPGAGPTLRMVSNPPPSAPSPQDRKSRRLSIDAAIAADPFLASKMQSVLRRAPSTATPVDPPAPPSKSPVPTPSRSLTSPPPAANNSRSSPTSRVPSALPTPSRSTSASTSRPPVPLPPPVSQNYRPSLDLASDDEHSTFSHSHSGHGQNSIRPVYPSTGANANSTKRERGPPPVAGTPSAYAWRSGQSDDGHGGSSNFYTGGSQTQTQNLGMGLPPLPPGAQPPQPGGKKRAPSNPPVSRVPYPANGMSRRVSVDDAAKATSRVSGGPGTWGGVAPGPTSAPAPTVTPVNAPGSSSTHVPGPTPPYGPTSKPPPQTSSGSVPNGAPRLVSGAQSLLPSWAREPVQNGAQGSLQDGAQGPIPNSAQRSIPTSTQGPASTNTQGSIPNGAARPISPTTSVQITGPGFDPYQRTSYQPPPRVEPGQIFQHTPATAQVASHTVRVNGPPPQAQVAASQVQVGGSPSLPPPPAQVNAFPSASAQVNSQPPVQVHSPPPAQARSPTQPRVDLTKRMTMGPSSPALNGLRNEDRGRTLSAGARVVSPPSAQNQVVDERQSPAKEGPQTPVKEGRQSPVKDGRQSPAKEGRQSPVKSNIETGRQSQFSGGRQSPFKAEANGRQSPSKPSPLVPNAQKSTLSVDTAAAYTRTPSTLTPGSGVSAARASPVPGSGASPAPVSGVSATVGSARTPISTSGLGSARTPVSANASIAANAPSTPALTTPSGRATLATSPARTTLSASPVQATLSSGPARATLSPSPVQTTLSPSPVTALSASPVTAVSPGAVTAISASPVQNTLSPNPAQNGLSTSPLQNTLPTNPAQVTRSPSPTKITPSRPLPTSPSRPLPSVSPVRSTVSFPGRALSSTSVSSYGTAMPIESEYAFETGAAPGPSRLALGGSGATLAPINTNARTPSPGLPSTPRDRLPSSKASEVSTPTSTMMTARMTPTTPSRAAMSPTSASARASSPITIPSESGVHESSDNESMHSKKRNLLVKTRRLDGANSFRSSEESEVVEKKTSTGLEMTEDPFARAPPTIVKSAKKTKTPLTPDATPDPNDREEGDATPRRGMPLSPPLSSDDHEPSRSGVGLGLGMQRNPEPALATPALTDNETEAPPMDEVEDMDEGEKEMMEPESTTPPGSPPPPKVYPLAVHLATPSLLAALLHELSFRDWNALNALNSGIRRQLEETRALREEVLEFWLRGVGYARWTAPRRETLVLSLRDLNAYMRGVSIAVYRYSAIAESFLAVRAQQEQSAERVPGAASKGNLVRALASSCRAYTKVILRLREQAESMGAGLDGDFRSPLVRVGHAPLLRVFVPSKEGAWLSDASVLDCEKELKRAGVLPSLRVGDVVWDAAVGDEGNSGRMVWDGNYLVDLDYTYSTTGELPKYINSFAFSPSYWHKVIRTSNSPLCHIDLAPYAAEIGQNLQLVQDRVQTETPQGGRHTVVRWVHRSRFHPRPGMPVPGTNPPMTVDRMWEGIVVVEVEGTNEGLADLQARCGSEVRLFPAKTAGMSIDKVGKGGMGKTPFRLLRGASRPGEIWVRAVREKERLM